LPHLPHVYFWLIARGLAELGHEVHLFAPPKSKVPPNGYLHYIPHTEGRLDLEAEYFHVKHYKDILLKLDFVIDCSHTKQFAKYVQYYHRDYMCRVLNVLNGVVTPPVQYNIVVGSRVWAKLLIEGKSQFHDCEICSLLYGTKIHPVKREAIVGIIPWAQDSSMYTPNYEKDSYYLFYARPTIYKGFDVVIKLKKVLRDKLNIVAGFGVATDEHRYWYNLYKPMIDRLGIPHVVNVTHEEKIRLMQRAKAYLNPIHAHEPFGLLVIEAMLCATPVIATAMGSMPEIIQHGRSGLLFKTFEELVNIVVNNEVEKIDLREVRRRGEEFDYRKVVPNYIDLAKRLERKGVNNVFVDYFPH